jgi:transposase
VSIAQSSRDIDVHENVIRKWAKDFSAEPAQAFPGHGTMKPEQAELERLQRKVHKLKPSGTS